MLDLPATVHRCSPSRFPSSRWGVSYKPKSGECRSIVFRDGDKVLMGSRNEKAIEKVLAGDARAVQGEPPERCVANREIIVRRSMRARLSRPWRHLRRRPV
jgi:hypothetical protein